LKNEIQKGNKRIYIRPDGSKRVATVNNMPTKTQRHMAAECDVNKIMAKYQKTGTIAFKAARMNGTYQNLSDQKTYMESLQTVIEARNAFDALPAQTRKRFDHDPSNLLNFLANDKNYDEAVKLGLVEPKKSDPVVQQLKTLNKTLSSKDSSSPVPKKSSEQ